MVAGREAKRRRGPDALSSTDLRAAIVHLVALTVCYEATYPQEKERTRHPESAEKALRITVATLLRHRERGESVTARVLELRRRVYEVYATFQRERLAAAERPSRYARIIEDQRAALRAALVAVGAVASDETVNRLVVTHEEITGKRVARDLNELAAAKVGLTFLGASRRTMDQLRGTLRTRNVEVRASAPSFEAFGHRATRAEMLALLDALFMTARVPSTRRAPLRVPRKA